MSKNSQNRPPNRKKRRIARTQIIGSLPNRLKTLPYIPRNPSESLLVGGNMLFCPFLAPQAPPPWQKLRYHDFIKKPPTSLLFQPRMTIKRYTAVRPVVRTPKNNDLRMFTLMGAR